MKHLAKSVKNVLSCMLLVLFAATTTHAQENYTLILAGYKAEPPVETAASGTMEVTLKQDTLVVSGSFENLSDYYYGSAIYYGEKDEQGNQIIRLNVQLNENKKSGVFRSEDNRFKLREGMLEGLSNGNLYIAISSFEHQRGELRAQLPPIQAQ